MNIIRGRNAKILDYIAPHLLHDPDFPTSAYLERLRQVFETDPSCLYILADLEQDEKGEIQVDAFIIAVAPQGLRHVFVDQAWCSPKQGGLRTMDVMFFKLVSWTYGLGREQILFDTVRDPNAFHRRWGFIQKSATMMLKVDEQFQEKIVESISHTALLGAIHGQEQHTEKRLNADGRAEDDQRAVVQASVQQGGPERDTLWGGTGSADDAPVRGSNEDALGVQSESEEPDGGESASG